MALKGIKVLELAGLAPAPFCGMILADFGAHVIRIDKIGTTTNLDCLSNGKQSIALNLKAPKGVAILKQLCQTSDVLLEPFRHGVMEKMGLSPNELLKANPRLIYARLSGYGQTGTLRKTAGHDINYLALSGLLSLFGRSGDEKPIFPVNLAADFGGGGLTCALGIILALFERSRSGLGQVVDCSMVEGAAYLGSWLYRSQSLPIWGQSRGKNMLDTGAHFYEVYETKDGKFMAVGAIEPQFYANLLLGLNLNEDEVPQYGDFEAAKLVVKKRFAERSQKEWCEVFSNLDACVTPVLSLDEAVRFRHNVESGTFVKGGPNVAPKLGRTPGVSNVERLAPHLGEHTLEVLEDLGLDLAHIEELVSEGVVECCGKAKL